MLGAMFMATDPVASPVTPRGMWIYGALMGLITVLIRLKGGLAEGVMYAILLGNALSPLIDNLTQPRAVWRSEEEWRRNRHDPTRPASDGPDLLGVRLSAVRPPDRRHRTYTTRPAFGTTRKSSCASRSRSSCRESRNKSFTAIQPSGDSTILPGLEGEGPRLFAGYDASGKFLGVVIEASERGYADVISAMYAYCARQADDHRIQGHRHEGDAGLGQPDLAATPDSFKLQGIWTRRPSDHDRETRRPRRIPGRSTRSPARPFRRAPWDACSKSVRRVSPVVAAEPGPDQARRMMSRTSNYRLPSVRSSVAGRTTIRFIERAVETEPGVRHGARYVPHAGDHQQRPQRDRDGPGHNIRDGVRPTG